MKRIKKVCAAVCFILFLNLFTSACGSDLKYSSYVDSHEVFGDGEFQLLNSTNNGEHFYELYNYKYSCPVLWDITQYSINNGTIHFDGHCPVYIASDSRVMVILNSAANSISVIYDDSVLSDEAAEKLRNYYVKNLGLQIQDVIKASNYPNGFDSFLNNFQ